MKFLKPWWAIPLLSVFLAANIAFAIIVPHDWWNWAVAVLIAGCLGSIVGMKIQEDL